MRNGFFFLILICCAFKLGAQMELGTYFYDNIHHSNALNPSFAPNEKLVISLPSYYGAFHQRGLTLSSFLGGQVLDVIGSRRNQALGALELSVLKVSYRHKGNCYHLAHNYKAFSDLHFSNPIVSLIFNGNTGIIGGSARANPNWEFSSYSETVLGFSRTGQFSFGINAKFLNGIQNISTYKSDLELSVNDDIYQLELDGELGLNSSFPIDFQNLSDIDLLSFNLFPRNFGVAFDIGASYKWNQFVFSASVLDLGYIRWNEQVNNYDLDGLFTYEGLSFQDVLDGNFDLVDTVQSILDIQTTQNAYQNFVPAKFYLGTSYDYNSKYRFGGLLYMHRNFNKTNGAVAVNASRHWNNKHAISVQYGIIGRNPMNLGINGYTTLGPIQVYGIFDNVIGLFNIWNAQNVNARIGINIVIDKKKVELRV